MVLQPCSLDKTILESQPFCLNERPPTSSITGKKVFLQTPSFEHQKASSASTTTNLFQQSHWPCIIVLNTNNLSGSSNNLYNQQQHAKITENSPKDSIQQVSFADDGHFGVVSAQAQTFNLRQQNACVAKDVFQQKYASRKAIAVVTPLTPKGVVDVSFSKGMPKAKEGGLESKSVPQKDAQPSVPHTFQATTNKNGADALDGSTSHISEVPSNQALATAFSHRVNDDWPETNNKPPGSSTTLSVLHNSGSVDSREVVQSCPTNSNCSVKPPIKDDSTVINPVGTRMDAGMGTLSTIPVQEWSLQRLQAFMIDLEQTKEKQQKHLPFDEPSSEIVKLYWNGDYHKLCDAAKSNLYLDIMKESKLYCGTKNSVILLEVSRERLNKIASNIHILKHDIAPPKMESTLSWLNLSAKPYDIDTEHNDLSSTTNITAKEVPVKEMENMWKPTNQQIKASDKALIREEEQREPLHPKHLKNSSVKSDTMVRTEPGDINLNIASPGKEIGGQDSMTVKKVMTKGESKKQNTSKCKNKAPLLKASNTQSSDVSDCKKSRKLIEKLLTSDTTPMSDKNCLADGTSVKRSILSPEKTVEPGVDMDNMQKKDAQILSDSKGQVTAQLLERDKNHMEMEMKSDQKSSGIKINWELENYCCLAKWFQVLGYKNGGLCKCEKKAKLSHQADPSGKHVREVIDKNRYSFNTDCKVTGAAVSALPDNKQAKQPLGYKSIIEKKSVTPPDADDDDSMNALKIVDVASNYEDVLKIANAMSEKLKKTPIIAHTSHESSVRKLCHKRVTTAKFKTGETIINLALFGTSHSRQKKSISSSDKVYLPPETINVRMDSGWNGYSNSTKSHTPKQQVWNSWKKTYVPSKMFSTSKSNKLKISQATNTLESKNYAADKRLLKSSDLITDQSETKCKSAFYLASIGKQNVTNRNQSKQKPREKICLTRQDRSKKAKREKKLALLNLKRRWNHTNHGNMCMKSSLDSTRVIAISKTKLNTGLALNFGVLPESFNISEGSSTIEANQFTTADIGSKVKKVSQAKRRWEISGTWCESPRKKHCINPTHTPSSTSGISTFQEFKKKYEEKKLRIHT